MPQLDLGSFPTQLFWLAVTFVILYFLMSKVALPKVSQVLDERQRRIDDNLGKAESLRQEARKLTEEYENSMAGARDQARAVIQEAGLQVAMESTRRNEELNASIADELGQAEARIAAARDQAIDGIAAIAVEVAASATGRLIGEVPPPAEIAAAVEQEIKGR